MQELTEIIQDQNQENRNLIVKLEELDKEKNNLEKKLRLTRSYYKVELDRKNKDLKVLERKLLRAEEKFENMRIRVRDADIELNKLKSIRQNAMFKSLELAAELNCEGSMSDIAENTEKLKQEEICKKKKDIALTEQLMGARISEHHITYNIRANAVQISDNGSIIMSSNSSVDKDRLQCDLDEPENQQHLEIEN